MPDNLFFTEAKESILRFVVKEYPTMPENLITAIIDNFYKFCNYEEESQKIKPRILITNNIDSVCRTVPTCFKLQLFSDEDVSLFKSRLKSLLLFCIDNWIIYVEYKDNHFNYGICRLFNSLKEKGLIQVIFESETFSKNEKLNLFMLNTISAYAINLKGIRGSDLVINFSINDSSLSNASNVIKRFANASFTKLKTTKNKLVEVKIYFENILKRVMNKIHGTICVVVDKDFKDTKGIFEDGIWLEEPIEFSKTFLQTKSYSEAKLTYIAELFISMLNYDGITIIDNSGKIRAYNVFIKPEKTKRTVAGGARKRAAYAIINSGMHKIVGVFFRSQDGEVFYEEVKK